MPAPQNITYGDVNLSQYFVGIEISRSVIPDVNVETLDVPGMNGTVLMGYRLSPLEITVVGTLNAKTASEVSAIRHALASALIPEGTKPLVLPDDPSVRYHAIPTGSVSLSRNNQYPRATITFLVPDGCGVGQLRTASLSSVYQTIDVGGNVPTWPIIRVNTPSGTGTVTQKTEYANDPAGTRETSFTVSCTNPSTPVDCQNESGYAASFSLTSDFQPLDPRNTCSVKANNGGTMQWFERWI